MKRWSFCLIGMSCALTAGASVDGGQPAVARPGMFAPASAQFAHRLSPEQRDEWRFLKAAAAAARFEHDAAKMALARSGDAGVRSLAAAVVNHQASSLQVLHQMLHTRNMAPPMLSNEQRHALNRLARAQGAKFDREWMESVALRSQQDTLQAFEQAAATARDPHLRSWIERTLPTLRYQLATAQRIVTGGTKFATLSPLLPRAAIKAPVPGSGAAAAIATRSMGAGPPVMKAADLGEGNMVLGPARSVAVKLTEPNIR